MMSIGWFADYPDPYDFINILLDGRTIAAKNNVNVSYFNVPAYQKKMDAARAARRRRRGTGPTGRSTSTSPATSPRS